MESKIRIRSGLLEIRFKDTGDIERIIYDNNQCITLYESNEFSGSIDNIYIKNNKTNEYQRLIGSLSNSKFYYSNNYVKYKGVFDETPYELKIFMKDLTIFYELSIDNTTDYSVYYAITNSLSYFMANEAYASQYLDHKYIEDEQIVKTRQNQGMAFNIIEGSFSKIDSYSTDAFEFFKKEYKVTNTPMALLNEELDNYNYQYESALTALKVSTKNSNGKIVFFENIITNYNLENNLSKAEILALYNDFSQEGDEKTVDLSLNIKSSNQFMSESLTVNELGTFFKDRVHEEFDDKGNLIAFFNNDNSHVVLKDKEKYLERESANIIISNGITKNPEKTFTLTSYIYGVFLSHIAFGNTNMNKLTSTVKDPLNLNKMSGTRMFVKMDNEYYELSMPAYFKLSASNSEWLYKINDDYLKIVVSISYNSSDAILSVKSLNNKKYDLLISNDIICGPEESKNKINPEINKNRVFYHFDKDNLAGKLNSEYSFMIEAMDSKAKFYDSSILYSDNVSRNDYLFIKIDNVSEYYVRYSGLVNDEIKDVLPQNQMIKEYETSFLKDINGFRLRTNDAKSLSFNKLVYWYTHDALIHYASPHGIEQYGGAAWGTRDILQGPVELFKSLNRYDMVKYILLRVYSRQFYGDYSWPQWFMFDNYAFIQAQDSASDIPIWPLKVLSEYILETGDYGILDEEVPYFTHDSRVEGMDTIREHAYKEIEHIKSTFIEGTYLPEYGNGDWDDTLNPKDREKAKRMSSPWTNALFIQALTLFNEIDNKYSDLLEKIKEDYNKYSYKNSIIAGFIRFDSDGVKYLLHPEDTETHLKYRLLPITRNMISEWFNKEEVNKYLKIIDENLLYPDGIRLMNDTVRYNGGENTLFQRAETSANFGREISLLYIHAHIRYIEAMNKIGLADRAYDAYHMVNPIEIRNYLKNADYRQSCSYFSSSDADFKDRYIANNSIYKIKTQEVKVRAGWRVYSSGPGIYLYELICNTFGIKYLNNKVYIDPVMSTKLDGASLNYNIDGNICIINYHIKGNNLKEVTVNSKPVGTKEHINKYRESGITFDKSLLKTHNIIDIYME